MARSARSVFLSILAIVALAGAAVAQESITEVVKLVKPAVVTVVTYDRAGVKQSQGSGFFIDSSHVITNWHVIDGASSAEVKCADGVTLGVKRIAAGDEDADLVSLELESSHASVIPLSISDAVPEPGERVVVVGSPMGLEYSVSDGIVSQVRNVPGLGRVIQISAPVSRGSSGSPVVNMRGEVVGVAQAIRSGGQNLNFAIPGSQILALKPAAGRSMAAIPGGAGRGPAKTDEEAFNRGRALVEAKQYDEALPHFLEAARLNPANYLAWFAAGHCYTQTGKYKEAVYSYMNAIRIKPDFTEAYTSLGASLGLMGNYEEAIMAFKAAIRISPDSAISHYGLGLMYVAVDDTESALRELKILEQLDPELAAKLFRVIHS